MSVESLYTEQADDGASTDKRQNTSIKTKTYAIWHALCMMIYKSAIGALHLTERDLMNLKKLTACAAVAMGGLFVGGAYAQSITNLEGTFTPWGGFDWSAGSFGWTNGFTSAVGQITPVTQGGGGQASADFTIYFATYATSLQTTGGQDFGTSLLDKDGNGAFGTTILNTSFPTYEYTALFTVQASLFGLTATTASYKINGATFDIYYDSAAIGGSAVKTGVTAWTGFLDGVKILSGNLQDEAPGTLRTFDDNATNKVGLNGSVTYTNSTYITPAMAGSRLSSTIQFGLTSEISPIPTSLDGTYFFDTSASGPEVGFQADGNQYFVPEPGTLLIVGGALAGLGFVGRRRRQLSAQA